MTDPYPTPPASADDGAAGRPPAHPVRTSRVGRDLPAAIGVGVLLGAVVIASLVVLEPLFLVVVLAAGSLGVWELRQALATRNIHIPLVPVLAGGWAMLLGSYVGGTEALAAATALTGLACLLWRLRQGQDGFVADVTAGVFVVAYVPLLGSFVVLMLAEPPGAWRVATFVVVTIASDIGGYAAGASMGRHPMAPTISPRKSWEGFAGSVLACFVAGVLMVTLGLGGRWWVGLVLGAAAACLATFGDLAESLVKRDLGIKDMGAILPGHGGVMDRLDSLLAVAPVAWLVLHLLV